MNYIIRFLQNIFIMALVILGMYVFLLTFYPETIEAFRGMAEMYTVLNWLPLIILGFLVSLLPRRRG